MLCMRVMHPDAQLAGPASLPLLPLLSFHRQEQARLVGVDGLPYNVILRISNVPFDFA